MKEVKRQGAQGDVLFQLVDELPDGATRVKTQGEVVVAHSETGHHHVALGAIVGLYAMQAQMYLMAKGAVDVEHRRDWNTHETLRLLPPTDDDAQTVWKVTRQREWTPDGWRQVAD